MGKSKRQIEAAKKKLAKAGKAAKDAPVKKTGNLVDAGPAANGAMNDEYRAWSTMDGGRVRRPPSAIHQPPDHLTDIYREI